jgi:hypothetical protein
MGGQHSRSNCEEIIKWEVSIRALTPRNVWEMGDRRWEEWRNSTCNSSPSEVFMITASTTRTVWKVVTDHEGLDYQ